MLFPVPRTGSERWRAYLQQRREYGDAQTGCPDAICEAERLFEIAGPYSEATRDTANYKTLQLLQNRDWAKRIAQSISEENCLHDPHDALERLNHALELDPDCITALYRRARL